jgi:hypothetical protein
MKNIKQNNLSLKALREEIEHLKASKQTNFLPDPQVKHGLSPKLTFLFIITTLITYAHKIPFVSRIIKLLSLWYGRTTWWKMLISIRKIFIIINAIIGVFTVFAITGFNMDNIVASIYALGASYVESLGTLAQILYKWFRNKLDDNIPNIPDIPNNPKNPIDNTQNPTGYEWGKHKGKWDDIFKRPDPSDAVKVSNEPSLRAEYIKGEYTPKWYWDFSIPSWVWYIGAGLLSAGIMYIVYSLYMDTTFFEPSTPKGKTPLPSGGASTSTSGGPSAAPDTVAGEGVPNPPTTNAGPPEGLNTGDSAGSSLLSYIGYKVKIFNNSVIKAINPLTYYTTEAQRTQQFSTFMDKQSTLDYNPKLYPYTEINPYDSWYQKLKLSMFGESANAREARILKREMLQSFFNKVIHVDNNKILADIAANTNVNTNFLGLGNVTPIPTNTVWDNVMAVNLENKLKNLTLTPKHIPDLDGIAGEWAGHVKDTYNDDWIKAVKTFKPATTSQTKLEDLSDKNPYDSLTGILD